MTDPSRSVAASRRLPASDHGTAYRRPEPVFNPLAWRWEWFRYVQANVRAHRWYMNHYAAESDLPVAVRHGPDVEPHFCHRPECRLPSNERKRQWAELQRRNARRAVSESEVKGGGVNNGRRRK